MCHFAHFSLLFFFIRGWESFLPALLLSLFFALLAQGLVHPASHFSIQCMQHGNFTISQPHPPRSGASFTTKMPLLTTMPTFRTTWPLPFHKRHKIRHESWRNSWNFLILRSSILVQCEATGNEATLNFRDNTKHLKILGRHRRRNTFWLRVCLIDKEVTGVSIVQSEWIRWGANNKSHQVFSSSRKFVKMRPMSRISCQIFPIGVKKWERLNWHCRINQFQTWLVISQINYFLSLPVLTGLFNNFAARPRRIDCHPVKKWS